MCECGSYAVIGWNERLYGLQIESRGRRGGVGPRAPPAPYIGAIYTQSTMRAQAGQGDLRGGRARPSRTGYVFYRKGPDKQAMNCGRKL